MENFISTYLNSDLLQLGLNASPKTFSDFDNLSGNPMIGSSWESFVVNQLLALKNDQTDLFFYRTHQGAEVNLVFTKGLQIIATAEIK